MSRDEATVLDILRAARLAARFQGDLDRAGFLQDLKTQSSVIHQLLVIGEAVKRLSEQFRANHPEVPGSTMAGMRDVLVHSYDKVDLAEVWKAVAVEIPRVIALLERIAPPES